MIVLKKIAQKKHHYMHTLVLFTRSRLERREIFFPENRISRLLTRISFKKNM